MDKGFARRVHALYVRRLPSAVSDLRGELFQPSPNARCTEYRLGTPNICITRRAGINLSLISVALLRSP